MRERKRVRPRWILVAAFAAMAGASTARADVGLLVPSYFQAGTGGPGGIGNGWAAMAAAASQVPVTAILNPNSGPDSDPKLIAAYTAAMMNLEIAGGKVVAYVYTDNGNQDGTAPIASVESQISAYISQYGKLIDGFFLDGMYLINTSTQNSLPYYNALHEYIKGLNPSYTIIGNPGQPYLNGVSPADYLATADVFNIFEGPDANFGAYLSNGVDWYRSYPSGRFSNIIYDVPASNMLADVSKAYQANAGYVYVTEQTLPNPFSQLPSYWTDEVTAVASLPEPSSFTIVLAMGGLFGMARFARCARRGLVIGVGNRSVPPARRGAGRAVRGDRHRGDGRLIFSAASSSDLRSRSSWPSSIRRAWPLTIARKWAISSGFAG